MPTRESDNDNDADRDEGLDDDEPDTGDPPQTDLPGVGAAPETPHTNGAAPPRKRGRGPSKPKVNDGLGGPGDPKINGWKSSLAIDLMAEVLGRLEQYPGLGHPADFIVQVYAQPDGRIGQPRLTDTFLGSFSLNKLVGDSHPGEVLQAIVTDNYHLPRTDSADSYDIRVVYAKGGRPFGRAKLSCDGREQIMALRRHQQDAQRPPAPGYGAPPGYGQPQAPYYPAHPPPGYGSAAPASPGSGNAELDAMRADLHRTQGALQEALDYARKAGVAIPVAVAAPPPPPAPQPQTMDAEGIARVVVQTLQAYGIKPGGVGAAPAPAPAADPFASMMHETMKSMMQVGFNHVMSQFKEAVTGVGRPPPGAPETPEPTEPAEPPPNPMDSMPFELVPLKGLEGTPVTWPDKSPMMYGLDKETGDISGKGFLMGNPFIMGQGLKFLQTLGEAGKAFAERVTLPNGSQVVGKTPAGAQDGTPRRQAPAQQQPTPQQAPPPPPPPAPAAAPPANGAGVGGFPVM